MSPQVSLDDQIFWPGPAAQRHSASRPRLPPLPKRPVPSLSQETPGDNLDRPRIQSDLPILILSDNESDAGDVGGTGFDNKDDRDTETSPSLPSDDTLPSIKTIAAPADKAPLGDPRGLGKLSRSLMSSLIGIADAFYRKTRVGTWGPPCYARYSRTRKWLRHIALVVANSTTRSRNAEHG